VRAAAATPGSWDAAVERGDAPALKIDVDDPASMDFVGSARKSCEVVSLEKGEKY